MKIIALVAAAACLAGLTTGCSGSDALFSGCTDRDERYVTTLAKLPIAAVHPDRDVLIDSSQGCDNDDGFAAVSHEYRSTLAREDVMSFYRAAATRDGWRAGGENPSPGAGPGLVVSAAAGCFSKEVDGATAYLAVYFPGDLDAGAPKDAYGVDITGSHDGDAYC